jgi:Fur family peroxide stress response transcriptional regulator
MTKAQKAILNAVIQSGRHLSADEIYWIVKQQFPSIALGTIYRNLNQFADASLIRRVARAGAPDYFEGNLEPHDHALCVRCGNMTDLEILNFREYLKSQMDCEIVSFDLIVNCICALCAQKGKDKPNGENNDAAHNE